MMYPAQLLPLVLVLLLIAGFILGEPLRRFVMRCDTWVQVTCALLNGAIVAISWVFALRWATP